MQDFISEKLSREMDFDSVPSPLYCIECLGTEGHSEHVYTGDSSENKSGWEVWFCCHACRNKKRPCESFFPIRLKPKEQ